MAAAWLLYHQRHEAGQEYKIWLGFPHAEAVAHGGKIVLVGHGAGHSNAAHHLAEYSASHHRETYQRIVAESVADLSHITVPQLLDVACKALAGAG